jgi:hypothetical protein
MKTSFICDQCHSTIVNTDSHTTGYGINKENQKICFACCGANDKRDLINLPFGKKMQLYFDGKKITNWSGSLQIYPNNIKYGKHNFCKSRTDVYFKVNGNNFHGVQMGDYNQILHINSYKS